MQVEEVSPELDAILRAWERNTANIKTLSGEHVRFEYNDVFGVEKYSKGKFFFEAPDKGRIDIEGVPPKPGQVGKKKNPENGQPFLVEAGQDQMWVCDGKKITVVDPSQKQFEVLPIPPEMQGNNIVRSPLPFLFGLKAEEAKQRFEIKLLRDTPTDAWLEIIPRLKTDSQNYQVAKIILSKETFVPSAVNLIDPSGSIQTTYLFDKSTLRINQPGWRERWLGQDPFQPALRGYKQVQTPAPPVQPIQPAGGQAPAGQRPGLPATQRPPVTNR
jgi:TIGR03009 family protein